MEANEDFSKLLLKKSLTVNLDQIQQRLGNSPDVVIRECRPALMRKTRVALVYIDGLVDSVAANDFIMESLMYDVSEQAIVHIKSSEQFYWYAKESLLASIHVQSDVLNYGQLFSLLFSGNVIFLIDNYNKALAISATGWKERAIDEPTSETVIRGPKQGFTENLRTNTALIRRKIKSPDLWMENFVIGRVTQTNVSIMYIKGIADDAVIEELRTRLNKIDTDSILESGYIEEFIEDQKWTPFPTLYNTERPDVISAELLEGKIAIIVDGTPFVLVIPAVFAAFFHSAEDYYHRRDISTLVRLLRFIGNIIGLLGPATYVAIGSFHPEMIPRQLFLSLAAQREDLPFPAFIEAILMELVFEILREASIRMPRNIGQAMSIVGSIVLGTAAVQAGFVSPAIVIVVSITAIASFVIPSTDMAISIRLLRFPFILLAASFGIFGIILGMIALLLHLVSLRSFGVPYMAPFAPFDAQGQKDTLFWRASLKSMVFRPKFIAKGNLVRRRNRKK
ncbi:MULTISPECIES: spore germination protein [unclassified Paenibacillus]|uniref:spore germination protein n=1 Tax=unclassified Paenibacillus TaxID=185978 RepID=UPI002F3EB717